MKSQPISARVCKAKIRNLGIRERVGRSAPPHTGLTEVRFDMKTILQCPPTYPTLPTNLDNYLGLF